LLLGEGNEGRSPIHTRLIVQEMERLELEDTYGMERQPQSFL
jgi:hypothetical protein